MPVIPGWKGDTGDAVAAAPRPRRRSAIRCCSRPQPAAAARACASCTTPGELAAALAAAAREATSAFGDGRVYLEKYIERPRHVEFQIFGDAHGHCVQLFERECSIQRRHQKIIEESPSPALTPALRAKMGEAALAAARAVGYEDAGTVEFILAPDGHFYFLEVNTRLQVEHPVTELVPGLDLVRAQILVAAGEPLPFRQDDLVQRGHAIECRIYAEDPARGFLPSTGRLAQFSTPRGAHVRVDVGVRRGSEVSVHYDPMLAKLVVWGGDREEARQRMAWALRRFVVLGVTTNIEFLGRVVEHPAFAAGDLHTHFLDEHSLDLAAPERLEEAVAIAAGLAAAAPGATAGPRPQPLRRRAMADPGRADSAGGTADGDDQAQTRRGRRGDQGHARAGGPEARHQPLRADRRQAPTGGAGAARHGRGLAARGRAHAAFFCHREGDRLQLWLAGRVHAVEIVDDAPRRSSAETGAPRSASLTAPMPGAVLKVLAAPGKCFKAHQPLVIMESMKMELTLSLPHAGRVSKLACEVGELVEMGAVLVEIDDPRCAAAHA